MSAAPFLSRPSRPSRRASGTPPLAPSPYLRLFEKKIILKPWRRRAASRAASYRRPPASGHPRRPVSRPGAGAYLPRRPARGPRVPSRRLLPLAPRCRRPGFVAPRGEPLAPARPALPVSVVVATLPLLLHAQRPAVHLDGRLDRGLRGLGLVELDKGVSSGCASAACIGGRIRRSLFAVRMVTVAMGPIFANAASMDASSADCGMLRTNTAVTGS